LSIAAILLILGLKGTLSVTMAKIAL